MDVSLVQSAFVWNLLVATALGALMGLERTIAGKQAGMRTYALVSLGSCLFVICGTLASYMLGPSFSEINPLQIAGSIVIGIGFIGSGLALAKQGEHVELTTASGIWVAAGVGMASGFGLYLLAFGSAVCSIVVFSLLLRVENVIRKRVGTEQD